MKAIYISPITEKGKDAIAEHVKNTSIKDKVVMAGLGIRQVLENGKLTIQISNAAINMRQRLDPIGLHHEIKEKSKELIADIEKMNVKNNIDFSIKVI